MGQYFQSLVAEPDRPSLARFLLQSFTSGSRPSCEARLLESAKRQHVVILEATLSPDGNECRLVMLDITERKVMESLCRQSQERHALAKRATQDGLWDWNILTNEEYLFPPGRKSSAFKMANCPTTSLSS